MSGKVGGMGGVFINYRTGDGDWAATLIANCLSARFGRKNVFFASRSISLGEDFAKQILARVPKCDVLLAVIGLAWSTISDHEGRRRLEDRGDWVRREIALALEHGVRVVPILLDGAARLRESDLPKEIAALARCQYLRLDHRNDYHDTARLVRELSDVVLEQERRSPLVITAHTTSRADGGRWAVDSAISEVPRPDQLGWQEWQQWVRTNGTPVDCQLSVRVESVGRQAVILERLRFDVLDHAAPAGLVLVTAERTPHRVALEPRRFRVDLAPGATTTPRPTTGNGTDFPYTVSRHDPEWVLVELDVGANDVQWAAELDWSCAGTLGTVRIDRGGEVFRTATRHGRECWSWETEVSPNRWVSRGRPLP